FARRFTVTRDDSADFPVWVVEPRSGASGPTLFHLHGGAYSYSPSAFHLRWLCRLSAATGARVVLPEYPLSPRHTWRDSHEAMVALVTRYAEESAASGERLVLS